MKCFLFVLSSVFIFTSTYAGINKKGVTRAAISRGEYCAKIKDSEYIKSLAYNPNNQHSYSNNGGLANGGVCWWHSMLQRNALYLAVYLPNEPKPSKYEARILISDLIIAGAVVEIPGYSNFFDFTKDFSDEIQSALDTWQLTDGGLMFGWVRGVSGQTKVSPKELKKMMDESYDLVKNKNQIIYQKLQIPGITSHAWLVVDMTKLQEQDGYALEVVDSNYPGHVKRVNYYNGDVDISYSGWTFVPYTSRNSFSFSGYETAAKQYCRLGITSVDKRNTENRN